MLGSPHVYIYIYIHLQSYSYIIYLKLLRYTKMDDPSSGSYPLVNCDISIENCHFEWVQLFLGHCHCLLLRDSYTLWLVFGPYQLDEHQSVFPPASLHGRTYHICGFVKYITWYNFWYSWWFMVGDEMGLILATSLGVMITHGEKKKKRLSNDDLPSSNLR